MQSLGCGTFRWGMGEYETIHVLLALVFGGLVLEDVGDLADLLVVDCGDWGVRLWGTTGDAEGVPIEPVFV